MNRFLLICLFSFLVYSCTNTTSQEYTITDITKILDKAEEDLLAYQGIETDSMMKLHMEYFHKAKTFNDSVHLYRAHYYLGEFYQSKGIYKDAMSEYEKALQNISDDADSARYIQTKIAIATTEIELGNKYKAGNILLHIYEVAHRNKRTRQLLNINGNMEILGLELKNYSEAKETFKEAIATIEEEKLIENDATNYVEDYINYHMFLAKAYQAEKELDSALLYIDKGINIADYYNDIEGTAYLFELKGKAYTAKKLFPEAYENLIKAKDIFETLENNKQVSKIIYLLADYHVQKEEYSEALAFLEQMETRYKEKKVLITDYYDVLVLKAAVYKSTKQFEKESIYRQKSADINDSILADGNEETVIQTTTKYEIEKIKNKYEAQHQKDKKRFYIFLSIAIVVVGVFGFLLYRQFNKKRAEVISKLKGADKKEPQNAVKSDKTVDEILQKLKNLEAQEFYLNPKYNLYATAKKIDTNTTYLSSILNSHKKMTFTEYLNNLRIQYTLARLENDKKFRMYTIKAIAKEVGYKSHGSFSRAFKAKTGENPSTYLKKVR
ncbi:helix-turn-helix domain-containing protein [Kordia sp. YSTF-M3]|uniref:Helix-turn-helix domain-containing protein n=1 Tax=Kordia aestuariivivens TaxID=2759037 RepID=A0ABR7QCR7_9FLAO|nr:AraC family transcriptional regulator [Kordia aestuariivivens]MBC8756357.1 helix-turn-helix domain-containing protein [Kordia aestuariivivens]